MARSIGFNKYRVEEFFNNYETVMKKYKFSPNDIYNIDETGVTTVMKGVKIVASTGAKQVEQISSAERGELVTFVEIVNAVGGTVPPVYIYPRIRNPSDYFIDAPIGSIALGNKSGWMTTQLFHEVLKHIVSHTNCSQDNKILILLDNHESHASVGIIDYCRNNGIVLLSFPPHTSHKLKPLDVGIYGSFKSKCGVAFNDFMLSNQGKTISIKNIAQLTNTAFLASFTPSNIISSLKKTWNMAIQQARIHRSRFPILLRNRPAADSRTRSCRF
ncbi:jerky protein homolog-like [Anoplophora glabripennis]|uniref:jerky protein homolog-like n=1 Tax=Anoplophora glabripennis TaxID=217634 RepID=UPI0008742EDB|nr:jerky protein homolog-like [Anoplophora glabripennis]